MAGPSEKGALFKALKETPGVTLDRHYRDYKLEELRGLAQQAGVTVTVPNPSAVPPRQDDLAEIKSAVTGLAGTIGQLAQLIAMQAEQAAHPMRTITGETPPRPAPAPVVQPPEAVASAPQLDPNQHAGVTLNSHQAGQALEVDAAGRVWFQKEVAKPGYAKPRGRRVLRDMDPGVVNQTITTSDGYTETFEIPGDPKFAKPIEIKVTLPSYQTGIYKDPKLPFKVHTYNGARGFDWDDVNNFYGHTDLVPASIKKIYVSSDLCYDITTTIRAIEDEYRERVLRQEPRR